MKTAQELFDISTRGIIAQGGPSGHFETNPSKGTADFYCDYRSASGRKCAAGQLVPDEDYQPSWETRASFAIDYFLTVGDGTFIRQLQVAHDKAAQSAVGEDIKFWSLWYVALREIARRYTLNPAVLEEIPV